MAATGAIFLLLKGPILPVFRFMATRNAIFLLLKGPGPTDVSLRFTETISPLSTKIRI